MAATRMMLLALALLVHPCAAALQPRRIALAGSGTPAVVFDPRATAAPSTS
jgi:hypothetical protein